MRFSVLAMFILAALSQTFSQPVRVEGAYMQAARRSLTKAEVRQLQSYVYEMIEKRELAGVETSELDRRFFLLKGLKLLGKEAKSIAGHLGGGSNNTSN